MKLRAWCERGVIIVAALATIATSRKGWTVEAVHVADDPTKGRIFVVEATHEPRLEVQVGPNYENPAPLAPAAT